MEHKTLKEIPIHHYIGCEVQIPSVDRGCILDGLYTRADGFIYCVVSVPKKKKGEFFGVTERLSLVKPILRPYESITTEEENEYQKIIRNKVLTMAFGEIYLISIGINVGILPEGSYLLVNSENKIIK